MADRRHLRRALEARRLARARQPAIRPGAADRVEASARAYARDLAAIVSEIEAAWLPEIDAALRAHPDTRTDSIGGLGGLLRRLRSTLDVALGHHSLTARIERQAARVDRLTASELAAMLRIDLPELPPGILAREWIGRNEQLTRKLTDTYVRGVEEVLREAPVGVRAETLVQDIMRRAEVTRSEARRVAVNETLTLYGKTHERRQTAMGIQQYIWSSSKDERVRPWHSALDGTRQRWDAAPIGGGTGPDDAGHPGGDAILCRCIAIPILP